MKQIEAEEFLKALGSGVTTEVREPKLILLKNEAGKIFAVIHDGSEPLRVEAKCDKQLARLLRSKYEIVQPSNTMEAATWNEVICADQLSKEEVEDLLRLSYNLVSEESED